MSDAAKGKGKRARLAQIDSMPTKELRQYARMMTRKCEDLQFRIKVLHEKRMAEHRKLGRVEEQKEELEAKLSALQKQEEQEEPTLQPHSVANTFTKKMSSGTTPRSANLYTDDVNLAEPVTIQEQTPVSQTQLSIRMPSDLKLADLPNNASQDTIEATPVDQSAMSKKLKSPAWESIKKKPRIRGARELAIEIPPAEQQGNMHQELDHDQAFKYLEVIRKQDDRSKLPAGFCLDCARFYKAYAEHGDLATANELVKRLCGHTVHQQTSRHRRKYEIPSTPPEYWDIMPLEPHSS